MNEEDKYIERAKRVENRVKEYSVKSENLITKFIEDFVFFVDNISRPKKDDKKRELSSPFLF